MIELFTVSNLYFDMKKISPILLILLGFFAINAFSSGIYKWEDEAGNVHYGDTPPTTESYETIKKKRSSAPKHDRDRAQRVYLEGKEKVEQEEKEQQKKQQYEAARKKDCETILNVLEKIKNSPRITRELESGEREIIGGEERQMEINNLQQKYDERCLD